MAQGDAKRHLVKPRSLDLPRDAKQLGAGRAFRADLAVLCGALSRISGILQKVSTLLITVGLPNKPWVVGKGGLMRGKPRLPSMDSNSAVSSPQI